MFKAFGPAMESGLPWGAVLGNHDQESTMTCEELMSFISLMDYSVSQTNPYAEDSSCNTTEGCQLANIDGFGNYNIKIYGVLCSISSFLTVGIGATVDGVRTYGWIKESQLHWLREVSERLQVNLLLTHDIGVNVILTCFLI